MPRQLLRDGRVIADDWLYRAEESTVAGQSAAGDPPAGVILSLPEWRAERRARLASSGRLGVLLAPDDKVEELVPDLAGLHLVASLFPGPSEGRGYSHARVLRERYRFTGEVRAVGHVRRDQLFFLARCGFDSFELRDGDVATALTALHTFSAEYQPANDVGLGYKLKRR